MKRLLFVCAWICAFCLKAAVPTFESFSDQFQTNSLRVYYRSVFTNDVTIIHADQANSLMLITNLNAYGTFSLPSKVQLLTLGTNYLDMSTNTTWMLNSPTNDATQVILSLSAGAYQGQFALITSQNGDNAFTLPHLSEQWDVPGAVVWLSGLDWIGTTNRGILLQYTAPDWVAIERFDPSGGSGGSALWYMLNGALTPSPAVNVVSNTVFAATTTFWTTNLGNATNPSVAIDGTLANPGAGIYRAANGALAIASTAVNVATFNTDSVRFGDAMPLLWSAGSPDVVAPRFGFYHGSGSPEGVVTANVGSLYNDYTGGDIYRKGSGSGNVGWLVLSTGGGGGTTINPTDSYVPYRVNATTFGDSNIHHASANSTYIDSFTGGAGTVAIIFNAPATWNISMTGDWIQMSSNSVQGINLYPTAGDGTNTFLLNALNTHTVGDILRVQNNGTNQLTLAAISGYTGAGTLFLSDDGTYKSAGAGSALWASAGSVLEPSPAIDLVRIESQLADNATNVALVVDTSVPWTAGAILASFANAGTNAIQISPNAGISIGHHARDFPNNIIFDTFGGAGITAFGDAAKGDGYIQFDYKFVDDGSLSMSDNSADMSGVIQSGTSELYGEVSTASGGQITKWDISAYVGDVEFVMGGPQGANPFKTWLTDLHPTVASSGSATAYLLDTSTNLFSGDKLLAVRNNSTNKFTVEFDGALTAGSTNQLKTGPIVTGASVALTTTNYLELTINGVVKKVALVQ